MPLFRGPLVYLADGTSASEAALSEVASFAKTIGARLLVAMQHAGGSTAGDKEAANVALPQVVQVSHKRLAADLVALPEIAGGVVALLPRRAGGLGRVFPRTTYQRLLRETPLPLLVLPADGKIGVIRRVLFPADLSPRSLPAFEQVVALCGDLRAELEVLHVYGEDRLLPSEMDLERRRAAQSPRELLNIHKEAINALIDRASAAGVQAASKSAEGRAHANILAYISENPIDLVVMPTHGQRTFEDRLRGTTTIRVLHQAPVPVLVLRA